jgi:hypothetical protein
MRAENNALRRRFLPRLDSHRLSEHVDAYELSPRSKFANSASSPKVSSPADFGRIKCDYFLQTAASGTSMQEDSHKKPGGKIIGSPAEICERIGRL